MEENVFFSYYWFLDEKEEDVTSIRIYGIDEKNNNICVRVDDFYPYIYLELPTNILWNSSRVQLVGNKIDQLIPKNKPLKKIFEMKYKLYGADLTSNGERKKFPYLKCHFSHKDDIKKLGYVIKKSINILGIGFIKLKMHEQDADPILQLVSNCNIPTAGWIKFKGKEVIGDDKVTICHKEFIVKSERLSRHDKNIVATPKIMGFDIEVNSTNPFAMPSSQKQGDKVFQISCVFAREGCSENEYDIYILTLGEPDPKIVGEHVTIHMYNTEYELLIGFSELIRTENPNVIVGYNILQFDIHYMIERAKYPCYCIGDFDKMGFHKFNHAKEKTIKWSSSAYKNQEFQFLDAEGRLFVDLLPLIKRDYKFNNYQLKTVSMNLLGDTKDDLSVRGIFKCYRIGTKKESDGSYSAKAKKAMGIVARYCIQDSVLVVKLMEKTNTWVGLTEQASTYNTSIFSIYTQGQQIKVFSQVYKYCLVNNIIVEKDGYVAKEDERYVGAHVFPPVPGLYERVLPFDFCFSADTLINLSNGLSKRIDNFDKDKLVLGFNKKSNAFENYSFINGLQKKGIRETVKIYFQDGSSIVATPEHKFMLENGEWCQAKDLKNKYVKAGIKFPEDKICDLEKDWKLEVEGCILNMKNDEERDKSLSFARMIGYILSEGSIYESTCNRGYSRKCVEACFGTMYDALAFKRDINLFNDIDVTIRKRDGDGNKEREMKGTTLSITIPANLSRMFHSIEDIVVGKRSTQEMKLPKFILDDKCPLSIIREFLGGLFGGDGISSTLCMNDKISSINFKWTTTKKYIENMNIVFFQIQKLLEKFNIKNSSIHKPLKIKYKENSIKPHDYLENPRYDIQINLLLENTYIFMENIGFRYCINKLGKSYFTSMYLEMKEKTRVQRIKILDRSNELININIKNVFSRKKGNTTFTDCLEIARNELLMTEPALYNISLSSTYDLTYDRHERLRHPDKPRKYSLHKKKFPDPVEYFKDINVLEWFKNNYLIKTDEINIPSFRQKVIDVREHDSVEVFDIEVEEVHNFLANGITASNCSLYPTTIIAYNIDYSTIVFDESIPDNLCHVMEWSDHLFCEHDPKVIRKNQLTDYIETQQKLLKELREKRDKKINKLCRQEIVDEINKITEEMKPYREERAQVAKTISKNTMCAERRYRFLKEPKGVIPTILQNLLDARANTRKIIKNNKKEMLLLEDADKIKDLKLLNNVLDKRQLAYKISANSMYGSMGVKKGYLPFMPGAMVTTFMGRTNIEIVAKTIPEKYGGELVYGDTDCVLATEPVLIKYNDNIDYKTVEELSDGNWTRINPNKEISNVKVGYQIWSDNGFTNIINVVRCGIKKPLSRVLTHVGVVNCSNEHSLLTDKLESITPLDIKIGDKLCISELPLPSDTPKKPLYNNKVTKEIIKDYIIPNIEYKGLTAELAFVWGLFFADGSCGEYLCGKYSKSVWAINNQDNVLLERVVNILKNNEVTVNFKIYDTMKSSNVNKLEAVQYSRKKEHSGNLINFVNKYRNLFYDDRKYKKIPTIMFNSPFDIRQSFFMGYYSGDGSRKDPSLCLSNKGAIGSAGLFYIMKSIGYQVSINTIKDKQDIYKLTCSTPEKKLRRKPNVVKKIINIKTDDNEYIYDIQTENHHFAAGVGQLIVHNSNYIHFPKLKTAHESWDHAEMVAKEVSKLFPKPISLAFEEAIYWQFFILTKKRYMYRECGKDGIVNEKIGKKGVLLARRDNAVVIRNLYEKIITMIFDKVSRNDIIYFIIQELNKICSNSVPYKDFVITKAVGDVNKMIIEPFVDEKGKQKAKIGNYIVPILPKNNEEREKQLKLKDAENEKEYYQKCLPAVVQLAEKMRKRGQRVDTGTRLEYVIIDNGVKNDKQYNKLEGLEYFTSHSNILTIDFMYYIKLLVNPIDQMLNVAFNKNEGEKYIFKKDFILQQYDFRNKNRQQVIHQIKNMFRPILVFNN